MRFPFMKQRLQKGFTRGRISAGFSLLACAAVAALLWTAAADAQGNDAKDPKRSRTMVVLRISEALDLDEEQTLRLASQYRKFDKRRHDLIGQRSVTEIELETALGRNPQDEANVRKLTDQLLAIDKELVLMPDALFESLQDMLDTDQRARLALLKIKLQRKIDRERGRRDGHAPGGAKPKPKSAS